MGAFSFFSHPGMISSREVTPPSFLVRGLQDSVSDRRPANFLAAQRRVRNYRLCDTSLHASDSTEPVHSVILATHSKRFTRMLSDSASPPFSLDLPRHIEASSLRSVIDWMYYGSGSFIVGAIADYAAVAAYFEIPNLRHALERRLVSLARCPATLALALDAAADPYASFSRATVSLVTEALLASSSSSSAIFPSTAAWLFGLYEEDASKKLRLVQSVIDWLVSPRCSESHLVIGALAHTGLSPAEEVALIKQLSCMVATATADSDAPPIIIERDSRGRIALSYGLHRSSRSEAVSPATARSISLNLITEASAASPIPSTIVEAVQPLALSPRWNIAHERDYIPDPFTGRPARESESLAHVSPVTSLFEGRCSISDAPFSVARSDESLADIRAISASIFSNRNKSSRKDYGIAQEARPRRSSSKRASAHPMLSESEPDVDTCVAPGPISEHAFQGESTLGTSQYVGLV